MFLFCNSAYSFTIAFKRQMHKITINLCYWANNVKKMLFLNVTIQEGAKYLYVTEVK